MKLTWYGQSAFKIEVAGASILMDPFLSGNPLWKKSWEGPAEGVTHVLLTHGHGDHVGDALEILKKTGAMLVANPEVCGYLGGQGVDQNNINQGNTGGTVDCGPFTTTFVQALHSSSYGDGIYMGNPCGLVLHFHDDKTLYHMGDTDIFSDMALVNELHEPKIGLVPVGDRFTMGGAVAALACRRYFKFDVAVPCHYATFGLLDQTPDKFVAGMEGSGVNVVVPGIGEAVTL
ncbi:metal-dependent hydrolase [Mesorhizobium sp. CA13]|uniref:metal-dependent hydrolase n=1 Tax=unclassified Mesorhizobium TaxID=325217 RepID=UPI0011279268|nr:MULTISPECIES: metal-dependent hydrolase [unclassified Mesorhizobium]MBZ9854704.1 metal-dependent hydrolase [Mesorhizobium sp. CA13]MBZ9967970.1 metal-dependent hydrolase [Mesorhizobium sp. BR1-1-2]MCA0013305.1 metal-dependent hydrolase [Mesorhizobium sp. B294B1A1]MCA0039722.1 metal-dependent hydrolase [Mesorhizobium sp. B292B1B]TPM50282.1 metal-dependent hydrolase [Mesorhizobium sp. B2-3-2]